MNRAWLVLAVFAGCGLEPVNEAGFGRCGPGTHLEGDQCFADTTTGLRCGPGTRLEGSTCVAGSAVGVPSTGLTCGVGTVEQAGVCVAALSCGPGTAQQGTQCVTVGAITCGAGTTLSGSQCVTTGGLSCGAGTMLQGSSCVPTTPGSGWYEVRVGATQVPADGYTKIPVLALGRLPNGQPATDVVVLTLSRPSAGSLVMPSLMLGELGSSTWFTPCSSAANAQCAGPATVELRLGSNLQQVLAESQPFTLVAPSGVGSTAPCDSHPNALFFDGMGYVFTGTQLVTNGTFNTLANGMPAVVSITIDPALSAQGSNWRTEFAAPAGTGPLAVQVYPTAERYPFMSPQSAGLSVTGSGRGCNQASGRFEVHQLAFNAGGQLSGFLATFEQFCEKEPSNVLRGCVKFTR